MKEEIKKQLEIDVIGLRLADANKLIHEAGFELRVTILNNIPLIGTRDYHTDRLNVIVASGKDTFDENSIVTSVQNWG